jgi:LmbE family N-acetylglucosaminyl deacetylase
VFQLDVFLILLTATVLTFCVLAARPKAFLDLPYNVLICCAHSDDCVIMGAEYAYGVVASGLEVRIAYLTCSGPSPDSEIAKVRKAEALAAWSALSVPKENLTFVDLSQSPLRGPLTYSDSEIERATHIFNALILSLPRNAAVIVPAQGESHVDHRAVRMISVNAILESGRADVLIYETPEYNSFVSLLHCPRRTITAVLRHVPLVNRFIKPYSGPANYVNGSAGFVFRDKLNRLAKKKELLRFFSSQDPNLLIRTFGHETLYRRLLRVEPQQGPSQISRCVSAFGSCCDPSALALGLAILGLTFWTAHESARILKTSLSPAIPVASSLLVLGGVVASVYAIRKIRSTVNLESALFAWAGALGLILGAL